VEPGLSDLVGQALVWGGAVAARGVWRWDRWKALAAGLAAGLVVGAVLSRPRPAGRATAGRDAPVEPASKGGWGRVLAGSKAFSRKMGNFQSRMFLSWVYFLIVTPFALAGKALSDPLRLKPEKRASHWVPKKRIPSGLEAARRQS
jgi:hypothetical protein